MKTIKRKRVWYNNKEKRKMAKTYFRKRLFIVLVASLLTAWTGRVVFAETQELTRLSAVKTITAPLVDGDSSDAAWDKTSVYEITLGSIKVGLEAVYTDKDPFILASWNDPTFSIVRGGLINQHY